MIHCLVLMGRFKREHVQHTTQKKIERGNCLKKLRRVVWGPVPHQDDGE